MRRILLTLATALFVTSAPSADVAWTPDAAIKRLTSTSAVPPLSATWFDENQSDLLRLLHHPDTREWFRAVLAIRPHDIGYDGLIVRLQPHSYTVYLGLNNDGHMRMATDVRTHIKYAKRLCLVWCPFWTETTVFPDPDTETTTFDGYVLRHNDNATWASIHDNTTGTSSSDNAASGEVVRIWSDTTTDQFDRLYRAFYLFDASSITDTDTLDDATISIFGTAKENQWVSTSDWAVNIYTSTPASNTAVANGDYDQFGATAQCDTAVTYSSWSTSAYNAFTLNATGEGNVSFTGVSKFAARESTYDAPDTAPSWESNKNMSISGNYADQTGTSNDPKLVINHTAAGGGSTECRNLLLLGVAGPCS